MDYESDPYRDKFQALYKRPPFFPIFRHFTFVSYDIIALHKSWSSLILFILVFILQSSAYELLLDLASYDAYFFSRNLIIASEHVIAYSFLWMNSRVHIFSVLNRHNSNQVLKLFASFAVPTLLEDAASIEKK